MWIDRVVQFLIVVAGSLPVALLMAVLLLSE
jgi:hypothetical protein